jgi:hypothetical protein
MSRVGFEPMTPVFQRAKMVYALDLAATVIGEAGYLPNINKISSLNTACSTDVKDYSPLDRCTKTAFTFVVCSARFYHKVSADRKFQFWNFRFWNLFSQTRKANNEQYNNNKRKLCYTDVSLLTGKRIRNHPSVVSNMSSLSPSYPLKLVWKDGVGISP